MTNEPLRWFALFLKGMSIGAANVVPGVSGGTMALITGVFERLIDSVRSFNAALLSLLARGAFGAAYRHVDGSFLLPVGLGGLTAIFSVAKIVRNALESHPVPTWALFFGLIVASVFLVARRIPHWTATVAGALFTGATAAYVLIGMMPVETPDRIWFIFFSGAVSVSAMILPGISGAHVLLVLGKYDCIIDALLTPDLPVLAAFLAGCVVGLAAFSRLLHWLLARAHDPTLAVLMGFMAGSLRRIWPWKETLLAAVDRHGRLIPVMQKNVLPAWESEVAWALLAAFLGAALVMLVEWAARARR